MSRARNQDVCHHFNLCSLSREASLIKVCSKYTNHCASSRLPSGRVASWPAPNLITKRRSNNPANTQEHANLPLWQRRTSSVIAAVVPPARGTCNVSKRVLYLQFNCDQSISRWHFLTEASTRAVWRSRRTRIYLAELVFRSFRYMSPVKGTLGRESTIAYC